MSRDRATASADSTSVGFEDGVVSVPAPVLERYRRYTAYNSPYAAHDHGCAVDCYPMDGTAPSPVAGEVVATETVRAPPKPYAPEHDHLVVVDAGPVVARIMHVDPRVDVGDTVGPGDDLGDLVRAGFFARWVPNHLHVDFRRHDQNHLRAGGSLPLDLGVDPVPVEWDGHGTVVDAGETYAVLDAPELAAVPENEFCGLAATVDGETVVLDGGFQHYDCGGVHPVDDAPAPTGPVELLGETVGDAEAGAGSANDVTWRPTTVRANGDPVHGVSLWCGRDGDYAIKLVGENHGRSVGEDVEVTLDPTTAE